MQTPEEGHQAYCESIAREAQEGKWTNLKISSFSLEEDVEENISTIKYDIALDGGSTRTINGKGQGLVDALFNSLVKNLSKEFLSLEQLEFQDFSVRVSFKQARRAARTDAPVEVCLAISTSPFYETYFRHKSVSLVSASIEVVRKSIEYFINLEKAFFLLRGDVQSAKERNRDDLIGINSDKVVEIIKIISFEKILK